MAKLQERFDTLNTKLDEASSEILAEIQTLKDELENTELTPEAEASLESLENKANALGDIAPSLPPQQPGEGTGEAQMAI